MQPGRKGRSRAVCVVLAIVLLGILAWSVETAPGISVAGHLVHSGATPVSYPAEASRALAPKAGEGTSIPSDPTLTWTNLSPSPMPSERVDSGMVYDSTDGYVLLFGGASYLTLPTIYYNDTWTYSGGKWTNVTNPDAPAPSPRSEFALADDPAEHEVVLFGGRSAKGVYLNDTWTYSAGVWANVTSTAGPAPPVTAWGGMAYDNQTESVILFGGLEGLSPSTEYTNETWSFHDNAWTQLFPTTSPPARNSESLVDDVSDGVLLMFGGQNDTQSFNDTWTFSGTDWSKVSPALSPPEAWGSGLAYYAPQSDVVLFGGTPASEYYTYTYHAGVWTQYDPIPNPGQEIGTTQMTYDFADQYVLLFGDSPSAVNSTWSLSITSVAPSPLSVSADATPQSGTVPLQTAFTSDISGGTPPYTLTWNFDDSTPVVQGSPSVAGNTSHTYEAAGRYNATLTVVDSSDDTVVKNWTITVSPSPLTLKITVSSLSPIVSQPVTFNSTPSGGTPPYTYAWTFGDGGTATTRNATHEYSAAGTFTVELVVHDQAGSSVSRNTTITVVNGARLPTTSGGPNDEWLYLAIGVVAVVIAILVVFWTRRRKQPTPTPSLDSIPPSEPGGPGPSR